MLLRCTNCGFKSRDKSFYRREQGGLLNKLQTVCEACEPYTPSEHEEKITRNLLLSPLTLVIIAFMHLENSPSLSIFILSTILIAIITLPLRIIVHEAGHAIAAKLVGFEIAEVVAGRGPRMFDIYLFGFRIEVRRYSYAGGYMRPFSVRPLSRWRWGLAVLAGPAANALCAAILFWTAYLIQDGMAFLLPLLVGMGLSQAITAIYNLIPQRIGDDENTESDGQLLLNLLNSKSSTIVPTDHYLIVLYLSQKGNYEKALRIAQENLKTSPHKMALFSLILHIFSRAEGDRRAIDYYLANESEFRFDTANTWDDATRSVPWIHSNAAWSMLKIGDEALRKLAGTLSKQALIDAPDSAEIQGTHGGYLIETGKLHEGLEILTKAIRKIKDPIDRADFCIFLSKGWARMGNEQKSLTYNGLQTYLRPKQINI